jgi:hypothetical protein
MTMILIMALSVTSSGPQGNKNGTSPPNRVEAMAAEADLIVHGVVKGLADGVATVSVDKIIKPAENAGSARKVAEGFKEVRADLRDAKAVKAGDKATFYLYGGSASNDGFEAEADAIVDPPAAAAPLQAAPPDKAKDQALAQFLDSSDAVVAGVVVKVEPVSPQPISEHGPDLRRATVQVSDVAKGDKALANQRVPVLFASSEDVRWFEAPKFNRLERGTFVLKRSENVNEPRARAHVLAAAANIPGAVFTALDPRSFVKQKAPAVLAAAQGEVKVDARYRALLAGQK